MSRIYIDVSFHADTREELHQQVLAAADAAWDEELVERDTELLRDADRQARSLPYQVNDPLVTELWKRQLLAQTGLKGDGTL